MNGLGPMANPMQCRDEWLIRLLVSAGKVKEADMDAIRRDKVPYASVELLRRKLLTKEDLGDALERQYHIGFAEPGALSIEKMALSLIPEELCRKHRIIPIRLNEDKIELLMANPLDAAVQDEVGAIAGRQPLPFFGLPDKIEELIAQAYSPDAAILDLLNKLPEDAPVEWINDEPKESIPDTSLDSIRAPVIRLANLIISQAIRMKASDIHVEHEENTTLVRYRIDGGLRNIMKVPKHVGEGPLVSRIKIMSNLDVADRRRPQDGRAKIRVGIREIGLRVSTIPTAFGEKAVLRILDQQQAEVHLEALGFRPEILARMAKISESNQGLLLMTGPTGSGKTTTLYSLLHRLKSSDINIVTVEDPIEYRLSGINQVQVNEKAGLNFATVLRSVLRQDPDVVLVGEIRDRETADIAFQAALTGHMVFSTLHTNDAIASINRLLDIGVERYKMAPALVGVVSQRLARKVCSHCKVEEAPNPFFAELLAGAGLPVRQFKGRGCEKCAFTGLSGRTAVTELLDLSDQEARDKIAMNTDLAAFREQALAKGWLSTMRQDILWHLSSGNIPFEEASQLLGPEPAGAPPKVVASADRADQAPQESSGRRILIVDDNLDNRAIARDTLEASGYIVSEVEDGSRAIQEIAAHQPDLVLLDIMMPHLDGYAVLKHLRQKMGLKNLPVMILTAMKEAESQAMALELGADDYVAKPFDPKILRARVQALFRRCDYRAGEPLLGSKR